MVATLATRYTRAEVATRNGRKQQPAWIIIRDAVYDVTNFLKEHPGGEDTILDEAGTDATKAFDIIGHSSDAKGMLAKYKIGEVVEEEKRYDANGKKKKMTAPPPASPSGKLDAGGARSLVSVISCGLLG